MRISLNLATRPYADQGPAIKRLRIGMGVLSLLLAMLGLGLLHFHQRALQMAAEEAKLDQTIAQIRQEEQGYQAQMQLPPNAKVLTQAGFLNQLFDEKSFSWTAAMEDLERVLPAGVQVTAIEPNRGKDGRLTLRLRVSGPRERSVEMIRNMERSRRFVSPRLSAENSEASSNREGDLQPVRDSGRVNFDILAEYNPATLQERKAAIAQQKQHPQAAEPAPQPQPAVRQPFSPPVTRPNLPPGMQPRPQPIPQPAMRPNQPMQRSHSRFDQPNQPSNPTQAGPQ